MKSIRNKLFGFLLMYKTSFDLNPILTSASTAIVILFLYSVAKIFGW